MPATGWLRSQLEAGVRYPTTPAGTVNAYGDTREMARELGVTQRSIQRYRSGERHPSPERLGGLRRLARRRVAHRALEPYRSRGAFIRVKGRMFITISKGRRIERNVDFGRRVSPAVLADAIDAAEDAMVEGRRSDWERAEHATLEAAFRAYEETPFEEAVSIDAISIQP